MSHVGLIQTIFLHFLASKQLQLGQGSLQLWIPEDLTGKYIYQVWSESRYFFSHNDPKS